MELVDILKIARDKFIESPDDQVVRDNLVTIVDGLVEFTERVRAENAVRARVPSELSFEPMPPELLEIYDVEEGWKANGGSFVFTIVSHPEGSDGFDISVCLQLEHLPAGPFHTLRSAQDACNQAWNRLRQ